MTTYDLARKQAEGRTDETDNALVGQKNDILAEINDGRILDAARALVFSAQLWRALGYGYKVLELKRRVLEAAAYAEAELHVNAKKARAELVAAIELVNTL
jgi:hypothetical protein